MLLFFHGCLEYVLGDPDTTEVPAVTTTETFEQAPEPGLDVLFVVDATGSMAEEQAGLAGAAAPFVGALDALGVDYQIGVTTTDPADGGALLGRPWIITPHTDDPAAALAAAIQVGTDAAPPSAGLDAAVAAIDDETGANHGFRRDDAALHVVFLSDGDDESEEFLEDDFLSWLSAGAEGTGRIARVSAVVGDVPKGCEGPGGTASAGTGYAAVAEASGGEIASICTSDFAEVAGAIDEVAVEWPLSFALQATPVPASLIVTVDGVRETDWTLQDPPAIVFRVAPPGGSLVTVTYEIAS